MSKQLKWPGFTETGSVLIRLVPESFRFSSNTIAINGVTYEAKHELHITLAGSNSGQILKEKILLDQSVNDTLKHIFESIDWRFSLSGPVHVLSRKKDSILQGSVIMLINMPGISEFYQLVKKAGIMDPEIPVPPPHITLYTYNCPRGISVPGPEALDALSVKTLTLAEFNSVFKYEQSTDINQGSAE